MNDELIIYLNGEFVLRAEAKISVFDQGVLMGDGVFEGIRTYKGRIFCSADECFLYRDGRRSYSCTEC